MFFQNLFDQEFQGYLVLGDRQASITYKIPANKNAQTKQIAWNSGPYDLSSLNTLTLYCLTLFFQSIIAKATAMVPTKNRTLEM